MEEIDGVAGETGDIFNHDHVEAAAAGVAHETKKFFAVFDFSAGNTLVGVEFDEVMAVFGGVVGEEFFLGFEAVELVGGVGGNAAVGGDVHGRCTSSCLEQGGGYF